METVKRLLRLHYYTWFKRLLYVYFYHHVNSIVIWLGVYGGAQELEERGRRLKREGMSPSSLKVPSPR